MSIPKSIDPRKRSSKVTQGEAGVSPGVEPMAADVETAPKVYTARQDFVFAVKLFGVAGAVVLLIWLMNRAVS